MLEATKKQNTAAVVVVGAAAALLAVLLIGGKIGTPGPGGNAEFRNIGFDFQATP